MFYMYNIRNGNEYGILDTTDGVLEYCTEREVRKYVDQGVTIYGVRKEPNDKLVLFTPDRHDVFRWINREVAKNTANYYEYSVHPDLILAPDVIGSIHNSLRTNLMAQHCGNKYSIEQMQKYGFPINSVMYDVLNRLLKNVDGCLFQASGSFFDLNKHKTEVHISGYYGQALSLNKREFIENKTLHLVFNSDLRPLGINRTEQDTVYITRENGKLVVILFNAGINF